MWKRMLQPRAIVALLLGAFAGVMVMILPPPAPSFSVALPEPNASDPPPQGGPFTLQAVSSNGQFIVTVGKHGKEKCETIHVWDRLRGLDKSLIAIPLDVPYTRFTTLFSPDEHSLAVVVWLQAAEKPPTRHALVLFDLNTGKKLKGIELAMDHVLFNTDGKLLYVNGGVLRDLETGQGIRKLETEIDGSQFRYSIGEFAIYQNDQQVRLRSWLTGREVSSFPENAPFPLLAISNDGQCAVNVGDPLAGRNEGIVLDFKTGFSRIIDSTPFGLIVFLSPDGKNVISYGPTRRHPWLAKWWPVADDDYCLYVTHWKTDTQLAAFRRAPHACFSPGGNQLAVMRSDHVIDVYDFPFHKPWSWSIGAGVLTAAAAWCVGWLWSRRRRTAPPPA